MKITICENEKISVRKGGVGLFLEDVNYAFDGGLYAEMLENRNFESKEVRAAREGICISQGGSYAWEPYPAGANVALKVKTDRPLYAENPHYLRVDVNEDGAGLKNKAYDGIRLVKGTEYRISFYVRSYDYKNAAFVGVYRNGTALAEEKIKIKPDGKWNRYTVKFKSKADAEGADFAFTLKKAGTVHVNDFTMMPLNAALGVFRRDLVELMKEIKPAFLRFPCGAFGTPEGGSWKDSVGPAERRKQSWNKWALHDEAFSHYGRTFGLGVFECFRLAEYLGAQPVPVFSCDPEKTDGSEFEACVQDALDLVEFANGGPETMWGRLRAELGHPAEFALSHLALELSGAASPRFEALAQRIRESYPELKLLLPAGACGASGADIAYCREERVLLSAEEMLGAADRCDACPRGVLVSCAELAAHAGTARTPQANAWECAIAEAAFLAGAERNADVIPMRFYAPLFARDGYVQRAPALIWMDAGRAFGSASYYVQKLYSLYTGDSIFRTETDAPHTYVTASGREGFTYLKIVNASDRELQAEIEGEGIGELTRIIRMEGTLGDFNSFESPELLAPKDVAPAAPRSAALPPYSFSVLVFRK